MSGWLGWLVSCVQVDLVPVPFPTDGSTEDPTLTGRCSPSDDVALSAFTVEPGPMGNQLVAHVESTLSVPVAVRCTLDADPSEVHLLEDQEGTSHTFPFGGLLPSEDYTCEAAAVCPRSTTPTPPVRFRTGEPPRGLAALQVTSSPQLERTGEYTLFNLDRDGGCGGGGWLQLVDREGRPRFWYPLDGVNVDTEARYAGDGKIVFGGGWTPDGRPRVLDVWDGVVYDSGSTLADADRVVFHHDGKQLADGRVLTLELEPTRSGDLDFEGFRVRLHDPKTQEVVWSYSAQQAVDRGELPVSSGGDEWHANWVDVVVEDGRDILYLSLCYYGWILRIDPVAVGSSGCSARGEISRSWTGAAPRSATISSASASTGSRSSGTASSSTTTGGTAAPPARASTRSTPSPASRGSCGPGRTTGTRPPSATWTGSPTTGCWSRRPTRRAGPTAPAPRSWSWPPAPASPWSG